MELLEQVSDFEVVGQAGTGEEALALLEALEPDVALVDVNLPGMSRLQLAEEVALRHLGCRILMISAYADYAYVTQALEAGSGGYLLKTASGRELVDALRAVADGIVVLDSGLSARLGRGSRRRGAPTRTVANGLTNREDDVLALLALGCSNKEIAARLALGVRTIESHVSSILGKLGVASRTEAVAQALSRHLVSAGGDGRSEWWP